ESLKRLPTVLERNCAICAVRFTTFSDRPLSTGKTSLVREVVSRGNFNPLFIDLRGGQFSTPTNLYYSISGQFYSFFDRTKTKLSSMQTGVKLDSTLLNTLSANVNLKLQASEKTAKDIVELLDIIQNHLPKENFHVVLTTSDSFFLHWITKMLHVPHITPYVVGDLNRKEAEEFFHKHVLPRHESKVRKELEGRFDHVYEITGTRMIIIDQYVDEYEVHRGKKFNAPLWNRSDFIKTMEAIVANPEFILEYDLTQLVGRNKVNSLIEHNFLHRRPTSKFSEDIINPPAAKVILTAMNKPSIFAMRSLLEIYKV
ncbi:16473_t:CDS:2, partial [Cetraspora pellucida]